MCAVDSGLMLSEMGARVSSSLPRLLASAHNFLLCSYLQRFIVGISGLTTLLADCPRTHSVIQEESTRRSKVRWIILLERCPDLTPETLGAARSLKISVITLDRFLGIGRRNKMTPDAGRQEIGRYLFHRIHFREYWLSERGPSHARERLQLRPRNEPVQP